MTEDSPSRETLTERWKAHTISQKFDLRAKLIDAVARHEGWEESAVAMVDEAILPVLRRHEAKQMGAVVPDGILSGDGQKPCPAPATDSIGSPVRYSDGSVSREYEEQPVARSEIWVKRCADTGLDRGENIEGSLHLARNALTSKQYPSHVDAILHIDDALAALRTTEPVSIEVIRDKHNAGICGHNGYECLVCYGMNQEGIKRDNATKEQPDEDSLMEQAEKNVLAVRGSYDATGFDACLAAAARRLSDQQPDETSDPKPCPFCGEKDIAVLDDDSSILGCTNCGAENNFWEWNTRIAPMRESVTPSRPTGGYMGEDC